jgi:hypothetical protein
MFEHSIEAVFQQMADQDQPQSRVSIQQALRDGRTRLRRRRLVRAVGTPVLAAAAVLAVAVPVSMSAGSHNATHEQRAIVVPAGPATSRHFSPLAVYASFGWLPAKEPGSNLFGAMDATYENLSDRGWFLRTYPVGRCERLGGHLECGWAKAKANDGCLGNAYIQARAPAIGGRPAYWAYDTGTRNWARERCLIWEYQPGGWAQLMGSAVVNPSKRLVVRVASAVRFGGHQPSFKFAAQLRNLPGRWQVGLETNFYRTDGALLAGPYIITSGKITVGINVGSSSTKHNKCLDTKSACRLINGYYVTRVKYGPVTRGRPQEFELWAADADSAFVMIGPETYKYLGLMYTVFSHMKMLGTNPAAWTTKPLR